MNPIGEITCDFSQLCLELCFCGDLSQEMFIDIGDICQRIVAE